MGTGGPATKAPRGVRSGEGAVPPSAENFCISYIKMVSFYAFPVIFIDSVLFKKGTLIKRAGPDTLDPPMNFAGTVIGTNRVIYQDFQRICASNSAVFFALICAP